MLREKYDAGAEFAVTEMVLRASDYEALLERAARAGADLPIIPGIMPILNLRSMTRMVELYQARTKDFSGTIRQRLPFYLFRKSEDYFAAGAPRGSAGVYMGSALMAIAGERVTQRTWHVVQHEGFHQFCDAVIGGNVPIWINEGLAEYFGEAIFTGDNFVSGVIPKWRLQRVRKQIQNKQFKSIQDMMLLGHRDWNAELDLANYDQAWSMAHFLAHGDDGRYQKAFGQLMVRISKGTLDWRIRINWLTGFVDVVAPQAG